MRPIYLTAIAALLALATSSAKADLVGSSTFDTNPSPADTRFTANPDGTLTAHYNSQLPTDKLLFPLSQHLTAADSFSMTTRLKILSLTAPVDEFAQMSFGLLNSQTTHNDRTSLGDTYDLVNVDYFPNPSTTFIGPSLGPTIITSKTGTESAFDDLHFDFGTETGLGEGVESALPLNTFLNFTLTYSAASRVATITVATDAGPLTLNDGGGHDGNPLTIQTFPALDAGLNFDVDSFGLLLWNDAFATDHPSLLSDVAFDSFTVTDTSVPEPASLALLALGALTLARRTNRSR